MAETRIVVPASDDGRPKRTGFTAIAGRCSQAPRRLEEIVDFTVLDVIVDTDIHPTTYKGVSGGGLWLLTAPNGEVTEMQRFLIGVIFFESDPA